MPPSACPRPSLSPPENRLLPPCQWLQQRQQSSLRDYALGRAPWPAGAHPCRSGPGHAQSLDARAGGLPDLWRLGAFGGRCRFRFHWAHGPKGTRRGVHDPRPGYRRRPEPGHCLRHEPSTASTLRAAAGADVTVFSPGTLRDDSILCARGIWGVRTLSRCARGCCGRCLLPLR